MGNKIPKKGKISGTHGQGLAAGETQEKVQHIVDMSYGRLQGQRDEPVLQRAGVVGLKAATKVQQGSLLLVLLWSVGGWKLQGLDG